MKFVIQMMIFSMLLLVAMPAWSATTAHVVVQIFDCSQDEDATEEQIEAVASKWLNAARGMNGGEKMNVYIRYPVVAKMGDTDFAFVIESPNLEEWGKFMDAYPNSPAADVDDELNGLAACPDSQLWEGVRVK